MHYNDSISGTEIYLTWYNIEVLPTSVSRDFQYPLFITSCAFISPSWSPFLSMKQATTHTKKMLRIEYYWILIAATHMLCIFNKVVKNKISPNNTAFEYWRLAHLRFLIKHFAALLCLANAFLSGIFFPFRKFLFSRYLQHMLFYYIYYQTDKHHNINYCGTRMTNTLK